MARTVAEIMNRELEAARDGMDAKTVRESILAMGITAVPLLDDEDRPVAVISLRDLVDAGAALPRGTRPALTVVESAPIDEAARELARTDYHHLVVVDVSGRAVGMVSALDLLRGVVGVPARHPSAFPHFDPALRVSFTDDELLELGRLSVAPEGAGVIVLVRGGVGSRETPVWAEAALRVRTRLEELLSIPQSDNPALAIVLATRDLRYRAAAVDDAADRERIVGALRASIEHLPFPAVRTGCCSTPYGAAASELK